MPPIVPPIGNFRVYAGLYVEEDELSPSSTRYRIVEAIVHLALSLLETAKGRDSLANVARSIIRERDAAPGTRRRRPHHIYPDPVDGTKDSRKKMDYWIEKFLRSMRQGFPPVVICVTKGEAAAGKLHWGDDMAHYVASDAGIPDVSTGIIDNMVNTLSQRSTQLRSANRRTAVDVYDLFKFQMVISVAHEIVHFLTGFLTGTIEPHTPPGVNAAPYDQTTDGTGEAGRHWESQLLGGFVECWSELDHPLDLRQSGVPYLFASGSHEVALGYQVSIPYIRDFLEERFSFPIAVEDEEGGATRRKLKRAGRCETTLLREQSAFRDAEISLPAAEHPSNTDPSYRYRAISSAPRYGNYYGAEGPSRGYYPSSR